MQAKKIGYFLITSLLLSGLICSVGALPDTTVSFQGGGVTVDLTFPEEAHPLDNIPHDLTITTNTDMILQNFTVSIKAPVNSGWQEIRKREEIGQYLPKDTPWVVPLSMSLPQEANGTLRCFIYILTNQTTEPLSYTFYTTQVREMTYSELLEDYNALNNTYNQLVADFDTLNNTYNDLRSSYEMLNSSYSALNDTYNQLLADYDQLSSDYNTLNDTYNNLQSSYAALNSSYNELSANYSILNNTYNDLQGRYNNLQNSYNALDSNYKNVNSDRNSLLGDISKLQSDYNSLNSTFYNVQGNFTDLQAVYDTLNQTYTNLLTTFNNLQQKNTRSESDLNTDKIVMLIFVVAVACLVAFIVYLKRKKEEPYVVIRKETVSMKQDEKP
jgi:predicted nuclease with TOPRIM domain